ncbi:MAG TPA: hypothetical protein PKM65_20570 [Spirochaetota bacterium]|nr:hypothetical protein [Spirochaetota bacterium]
MNNFISIPTDNGIEDEARKWHEEHGFVTRVDGIRVGNEREQFVGTVGEIGCCEFFGVPWPKLSDPLDYGYDFVYAMLCVDAKTAARHVPPHPNYVHTVYKRQYDKLSADAYVFLTFIEGLHRLVLCGWLYHEEVRERGLFFAAGSKVVNDSGHEIVYETDRWQIEYRNMRPVHDLKMLDEYKDRDGGEDEAGVV